MHIKFYGTRGSIPVPGVRFSNYGGNTTCVLVSGSSGFAILDAGSGLRVLGDEIQRSERFAGPITILLSHTHWDHIQGFPFFKPAFDPARQINVTIHGRNREQHNLRRVFAEQMEDEYFPIPLQAMSASIRFDVPDLSDFAAPDGSRVRAARHSHPGGAYGYRFEGQGRTLVYCTDVEHEGGVIDEAVVELASGADLLIHDAQYTDEELSSKAGWGHSSWRQALEVARRAGVDSVALTHHDPEHDDDFLAAQEAACQREFPNSVFAREGLEIDLG